MKQINYRLYFFELVFVSLVSFAHIAMSVGSYTLDSLGRTTVLFFFMLSSYFYCRTINKEGYNYKKDTLYRCIRLLIIWIATYIIYFAIYLPFNISDKGNPALFTVFNWDNILDFFKNYVPRSGFLWFIPHLVVCYLIYPLINKIKWIHENKYSIILPFAVLFLVYFYRVFAGKYDFVVGSFSFSKVELTRNFLLTGLPCFLIGNYIYDNLDKINELKPVFFYVILILLIGMAMGEAYFHHRFGSKQNEYYLASIMIAFMSLIYCLQKPEFKFGEFLYKLFGSTGPMFVYLSHVAFLMLYGMAFTFNFAFILIIFLSVLSSLVLAFIYHQVKIRLVREK